MPTTSVAWGEVTPGRLEWASDMVAAAPPMLLQQGRQQGMCIRVCGLVVSRYVGQGHGGGGAPPRVAACSRDSMCVMVCGLGVRRGRWDKMG